MLGHGIHQSRLHRQPGAEFKRSDLDNEPRIVKIQANTVRPIVINSVPKCKASKSSRSHPIETINGFQQDHQARRQSSSPILLATQQLHKQPLQQQQVSGRGKAAARGEQVLLIVQDSSVLGGGIPVLGRRLPSKSMDHHRQHYMLLDEHQERLQAPLIELAASAKPGAPSGVVGRRTHRMLQQQQLLLPPPPHSQDSKLERNSAPLFQQQQRRSGLEQQRSELLAGSRDSIDNCPECCRSQSQSSASAALTIDCFNRESSLQQQLTRSNSCQQVPLLTKGLCADKGCDCAGKPLLAAPSHRLFSRPANQAGKPLGAQRRQQRPSRNSHYHDNRASLSPAPTQKLRSSSCHEAKRLHSRHQHLLTTVANADQGRRQQNVVPPVVHPKPNFVNLIEASHRFDCVDDERVFRGSRQHVYHDNSRRLQQQAADADEVNAVTQMYESLAAELKAKLGNPKMGPILLPPKDYDTMSRKQGKLNGIELRRSTNPQLVGPHGTTLNLIYKSANSLESDQSDKGSSPNLDGQAASSNSFRGQPREEFGEDSFNEQRLSRSNSSSGLGSISMGANSPHSQASSNDQSTNVINNASSSTDDHSDSGHSSGSGPGSKFKADHSEYQQEEQQQGKSAGAKSRDQRQTQNEHLRGLGYQNHNPSKVSGGVLWNGRVEIPLKINSNKHNGNTYLATKQIIY